MTGWRAKEMGLGELAHFQHTFREYYDASPAENRPALFSRTAPGAMTTVLIPAQKAAIVETLSPSGWRDYPDAVEEEWKLLVGDDRAFEELGLKRKAVSV